jgi:ferredoxin
VKAVIDSALCNAHGLCAATAPDVYEINDDGFNAAAGTTIEIAAGKEAAARAGAAACPEAAIQVVP